MSQRGFAVIFPGQGSQSIGMLSLLAERFPIIHETFSEVSAAVSWDVWDLLANGPSSKLNQTEYTQVVMLATGVSVYRTLKSLGLKNPDVIAGHSLGEYAALVSADALELEEAAKLVQIRGKLMQSAIPLGKGAMAAIVGLSDDEVFQLCQKASSKTAAVMPANFNAPGQVVVAGHTAAVELAVAFAEAEGARLAKLLPISVPCHCLLLKEMSENFKEYLENTTFKLPTIPVISSIDLSYYTTPEKMKAVLATQLYSSVRWVDTIQKMITAHQISLMVESGPGKVLTGLVKRISREVDIFPAGDVAQIDKILEVIGS